MENLSHAFIDRGFLNEAERLAQEAAALTDQSEGAERSASALARIEDARSSEAKKRK
jgi:hypothetical protein